MRRFGPPGEENEDGDAAFKPLTLTGLEVLSELNGKTYLDIASEPKFSQNLLVYDNQTIRTVVVRQWPNEEYLYRVFHRLNTESVPLSPQELRQALHPGPFLDFVDKFSSESKSIQQALRIDRPDFRMRDVELLIRFYGFSEFLPSYRGNLKAFLDETSAVLNQAWPAKQEELERIAVTCENAIDATISIFGENAFGRWNGERYERRFNRAVFDIMTFYFKKPEIAAAALERPSEVKASFEELCVSNDQFRESIQTTTKSVEATFTRLRSWGDALAGAANLDFARPALVDKAIQV